MSKNPQGSNTTFLSYDFNTRLFLALALVELYVLLFPSLNTYLGEAAAIVSLLPALLAGWLLGLRLGFLVGVLVSLVNFFLLHFSISQPSLSFLLGSAAIVLIAFIVGWLSDLLKKSHYLESELKARNRQIEEKIEHRSQQLEEEKTQFEASINSLNIGFIITNTKSEIVNINSAAKRLLCLDDIKQKHCLLDTLSIKKECNLEDIQKQLTGVFDLKKNLDSSYKQQKPIDSGVIEFKDLFIRIYMTPIVQFKNSDLKIIGTVIIVEDTTKEKILERSREEFFSIASHELRTPLTAIRGNTSLIKDFYSKKLAKDKDLSEMIDDIHSSSIRLIQIVNDFLDTSRLEQGRLTFKNKEFSLKPLFDEAEKELSSLLEQKKLYLKIEIPSDTPNLMADRDRLKQVLINLIGNSLKFTQNGGVSIRVEKLVDFLKVFVSDTGKGIELRNQRLLFRKFEQATNNILTRDASRGTGLGLYISKLMVEGMGGKIYLEKSVPGEGTTFAFELPTAKKLASKEEKKLQSVEA